MSIVIITFKDAPKVSQEAVAKERELDERIETNIKGIHFHSTSPFCSIIVMEVR